MKFIWKQKMNRVIKIIGENLFSYKKIEYNFEEGIKTIYGENGEGKSNIFKILTWIVWGKINENVLEIVRNGSESGYGNVLLEKNNKKYKIIRIKGKISNLTLIENEKDISLPHILDTQKKINELFGEFEYFINSVFSPQETNNEFLFGTDTVRKNYLTTWLNLQLWDKCEIIAKEKMKFYEQNNIKLIATQEFYEQKIREKIDKPSGNMFVFKKRKISLEKNIKEIDDLIQDFFNFFEIISEINILKENFSHKQLMIFNKQKIIMEYELGVAKKHHQEAISIDFNLNEKNNELLLQLHKIEKLVIDVCPTCGQKLDKAANTLMCKKIQKQLDDLMVKKNNSSIEKEKYNKIVEKLETEMDEIDLSIEKEKMKKEKIKMKQDECNIKMVKLTKQCGELDGILSNVVNDKGEILISKKTQIIDILQDENEKQAKIYEKLENEMIEFSSKLEKYNDYVKALEIYQENEKQIKLIKQKYDDYKFWVKGFGKIGARVYIIASFLNLFENKINVYLEMFMNYSILISPFKILKSGDSTVKINISVIITTIIIN